MAAQAGNTTAIANKEIPRAAGKKMYDEHKKKMEAAEAAKNIEN